MKVFKLKSLALALCSFAAASSAHALVTTWDVTAVSNFDSISITPTSGITASPVVNPTSLRWGTPATSGGQSGLDITNLAAPVKVNTSINPAPLNAPVATTNITHLNRPITGTTLTSVDLLATLTLKPFVPSQPALPTANITFGIKFLETPNAGGIGGACAGGGISGAAGVNANGCADIFVIDQNALNFVFSYDDGSGALPYFISFLETTSGLNPLNSTACLSATGSSAPCLGFLTPEGVDTTVTFGAIISTERVSINVPEPGALALLGLSLGAMGFVMRRKK